ncbi:MAG: hypothetical protein GY816_11130 [Cytophagales bacterium]|nr:hypothetical protein [Cytophagales bacterium]
MKPYLILMLCFFATIGTAQIKFSMNMTDSRVAKLQKSKDARTKLERYKKMYAQDSMQAYKDRQKFLKDSLGGKRQLKHYNDSLQLEALYKDNLNSYLGRAKGMKDQYAINNDSLSIENWKKDQMTELKARHLGDPDLPDSLQGIAVMAKYGMYGTMMETYASRKGIPTDSSSLAQQLAVEDRVKAYLPEELQGDQEFGSFQDHFMGGEEMDKDNPTGMFADHLPPEQMKAATTAMSVLKKGYISVSNTNDLSTAKKRKSLEGAPFRRRLFLGGNVAIKSVNPVILDTDIQVGYKFNRDFYTGVGFIIREQFSDQPSALVGDAYGHTFFVNHDLPLGIFAYGEVQNMNKQSLFQENLVESEWEQSYLLGIGKELPLTSKINLTAMILYDLNYKRNDLNGKPIVIRFGYRISELALW